MSGMEIYEDARTVSRADLAAWLRQLASQLESGAHIFYGAAGTVAVADQVHCELEIEREDGEISVEIEFSWASPEAAGPAATVAEEETAADDRADGSADDSHSGDADADGTTDPAPDAVETGSDREAEAAAKA
jgi:amphi-Trp domain-containing protein